MAKIRERMYVRCPFRKAPSYLNYYLDALAKGATGQTGVLRLTVPLADIGLPGGVALERDVEAHFTPVPADKSEYGTQVTAIDWAPAGGGPFPVFNGSISVETDEDYGSCSLLIEGDYEPPMGLIGEAFDATVGRKIAKATARQLLRELRQALEEEYSKSQPAAR